MTKIIGKAQLAITTVSIRELQYNDKNNNEMEHNGTFYHAE